MPGTLYIVATPIGNKDDFSRRGLEVISSCKYIACEDTRTSALFFASVGIKLEGKKLISYHAHNYKTREAKLLSILEEEDLALVSDAGLPCISDPGYELVEAASRAGLSISVIPGPTAFVTALCASGLSARNFYFAGFLASKGRERQEAMKELATREETFILYEAPHRLQKTLREFLDLGLAGRRLCLARELTKKHEEFLHLSLEEALEFYEQKEARGEYVLVFEGLLDFSKRSGLRKNLEEAKKQEAKDLEGDFLSRLRQGTDKKLLIAELKEKQGLTRNEAYDLLEAWKKKI